MKLVTDKFENRRRAALQKACTDSAMWQSAYHEVKADLDRMKAQSDRYEAQLTEALNQLDSTLARLRRAQSTLRGIEEEWRKERALRQSFEAKWSQAVEMKHNEEL